MSLLPGTYNIKKNIVTISGVLVSGYIDGAGLRIVPMSPEVVSKSGADGKVAYSVMQDNRMTIEIRLLPSSSSVPALEALKFGQRASGRIVPLPFSWVDTLTGETITDLFVFTDGPEIELAKEMGERLFKGELAQGRKKYAAGVRI